MTAGACKDYGNIYGRKGGRGGRPYFIVIKLICVTGFLGGLMTLLTLMLVGPSPASRQEWQARTDLISTAFRWIIIPGVTGAEIAGLILLASVWRILIRMRWLMVKAVLILVCMPSFHLLLSSRSENLHAMVSAGADLPAAAAIHAQMLAGSAAALAVGIIILILGRIKPRLGQDFGRTFARRTQCGNTDGEAAASEPQAPKTLV